MPHFASSSYMFVRCLVGALLLPSLFATAAAAQTTFVVSEDGFTLDANPGDGVCADGNGVCTWSAVANEIQGTIGDADFIVTFDCAGGICPVLRGRDFTANNGGGTTSITIQGPVFIDADSAWGLRLNGFTQMHVDQVTILGTSSGPVFPPADQGIQFASATLTACSISNSFLGGLSRLFLFDNINPVACVIEGNSIGIDPADGSVAPNRRGIVADTDGMMIIGNTVGETVDGPGIDVVANGVAMMENLVGVTAGGAAHPNSGAGIQIVGDNHVVTNNRVANNENAGINIDGDFNVVHGNIVLNNIEDGIDVSGDFNCIGAPACVGLPPFPDTEGNLASENGLSGIRVRSGSFNVLAGNIVGLAEDGVTGAGNSFDGITLARLSDNTHIVGGVAAANVEAGVFVDESDDNIIEGMLVGLSSLLAPRGNGGAGIEVFGGSGNNIGDPASAFVNTIGANPIGIVVVGSTSVPAEDTVIYGNEIGLIEGEGTPETGNGIGVLLVDTAKRTLVERNDIYRNLGIGIAIEAQPNPIGSAPDRTNLLDNVLANNTGCGISIADRAVDISRSILLTTIGSSEKPNIVVGNRCGIELLDGARLSSIQGNYVGITGQGVPNGNRENGIQIAADATDTKIGGTILDANAAPNFISANVKHGVDVAGPRTIIAANFFGVDDLGQAPLDVTTRLHPHRNHRSAISVTGVDVQVIEGNVLGSSGENGVHLSGATDGLVADNIIGETGFIRGDAVRVDNGGTGHAIRSNRFGIVGGNPVTVRGAASRRNSILSNTSALSFFDGRPIVLFGDANDGITSPTDFDISQDDRLIGTACANCFVQVHGYNVGELSTRLVGEGVADGAGLFELSHTPVTFRFCTATDLDGNTSEFGCADTLPWEFETRFFLDKGDVDVNGGTLESGDILEYRLSIFNDTATAYVDTVDSNDFIDVIPEHTTYVDGSLVVNGSANDDDLADGSGFDSAANAIVYNGNSPSATTVTLVFQVRVDDGTPADTAIRNQASYVLQGSDLSLDAHLSDDPDAPGTQDPTVSIVGDVVPEPSIPEHPRDPPSDGGIVDPPRDDAGVDEDGGTPAEPEPVVDGGTPTEPDPVVDGGAPAEPEPTPGTDAGPGGDEPACGCQAQGSAMPPWFAFALFAFVGQLARSRRRTKR